MFRLTPPFLQLPRSAAGFVTGLGRNAIRVFRLLLCNWEGFRSGQAAGAGRGAGVEAGTCVPAGTPQAPRCGLEGFQLSWKPLQMSQNQQTKIPKTESFQLENCK